MKWFAVILALANVVVFLLGERVVLGETRIVKAGAYEEVNALAMTTISPNDLESRAELVSSNAKILQADSVTQLKVNDRGVVEKKLLTPDSNPRKRNNAVLRKPEPEVKRAQQSKPTNETLQAVATRTEPESTQERSAPAVKKAVQEPKPVEVKAAKRQQAITKVTPVPARLKEKLGCYRIGPYTTNKSLTDMRETLVQQKVKYTLDQDGAKRAIKAVRVYMGGFTNAAQLDQAKKRLASMSVDYFAIRLKGQKLLQVGYFSEPDRAAAYQDKLRSKGLTVNADTIYHDARMRSWLKLNQITSAALEALNIPKQLKIVQQPCR